MEGLLKSVREEAWDGLIPAEFWMDSAEVTTLQRPLPLYLLLPRMGFLPSVVDVLSHHFGEAAPEVHRALWLEETCSGEPLRWHLPTGVLFDLLAGLRNGDQGPPGTADEGLGVGMREDEERIRASRRSILPWRITVHFQGCPRRQVFPLEKEADIRRHYMNALKQALYLQHGSSRVGMSLAKDKQERLWQAVKSNDVKLFHEIEAFLGGDEALRLVPVRFLRGANPPSQLPIPTERPGGGPFTLRDCLCWFCPDFSWEKASACGGTSGTIRTTGVGLSQSLTAGDGPAAAAGGGTGEETKGSAFLSGGVSGGGEWGRPAQEGGAVGARYTSLIDVAGAPGFLGATEALPRVLVQGIEPPLDASIAQLWGALRHPDHFLYIVLRKS